MCHSQLRMRLHSKKPLALSMICWFLAGNCMTASAQPPMNAMSKVLTLSGEKFGARDLPQDQGATGVWQRLLKLKTIGSILYTQAHPDDEQADLLTYASRGKGCRTALLSLNRGESGANVLGNESFDHLGLLRTEEFLLAGAYYGLDDLYFTKLADYGFSKRVEEAYEKWGRENVLREMVRVIRINRPLVIISRWHGSNRDGHGNHQAAGELTPLACRLAGDSAAFPELLKEGLRPWKAAKLYRGGVRRENNEPWQVEVNTGEYCPWLGQSYKNFSLLGYSMHRSQVGGIRNTVNGPFKIYYERLWAPLGSGDKETGFFDGLDTAITGIFPVTGESAPEAVQSLLQEIATEVSSAIKAFQVQNPAAVVPFLTKGLSKTRVAIKLAVGQPEALFMLQIKERQFMDAINTALGVKLQAIAVPLGTKESGNFFDPQPTMGFAVAGRPFNVNVLLENNGPVPIDPKKMAMVAAGNWNIKSEQQDVKPLQPNEKSEQLFTVVAPADAANSQAYFSRASIQESEYQLRDMQDENMPGSAAALRVAAAYLVNDEWVEISKPVQVRQANLPYGYDLYTLKIAPAIAVNVKPKAIILPQNSRQKTFNLRVELINNFDSAVKGEVTLKLPAGWKAQPERTPFSFTNTGEKGAFVITVNVPSLAQKAYKIEAVANANGKCYTAGYDVISYRDLDQSVMYAAAVTMVKGIDVRVAGGLRVGYVMGVGDELPVALQQLGTQMQLLTADDLSAGNFNRFDAVIVGVRAYAVRQDLRTYNQSLLQYAKNGGHLIVLYQTPEFVPVRMAPYAADLPNNAEEVSEETAPVQILSANHPVLMYPNKITLADFDNWVEQRGSKFFSEWDSAYVPIVSSNDVGQQPQSGGWLMAKLGAGHYTYFAYSLHRQLPYGVAGAYRLLANLVSYGRTKPKEKQPAFAAGKK